MAKKRGKRKGQGMTPVEVESLGRLTSSDFDQITAYLGTTPKPVESRDMSFGAFIDYINDVSPAAIKAESSGAAERPAETPLLKRGESSRYASTWKTPDSSGFSESIVLDRNNNPVIKPGIRCIDDEKVGIDWVSCVFEPAASWMYSFVGLPSSEETAKNYDQRLADEIKRIFLWVLGFADDEKARWKIYDNGLNGYKYAIGMPYGSGLIHVGHSSNTALVMVKGQGCMMAAPGWENRLYRFLTDVNGWLTRIDMAFDDFEGQYFPVRRVREMAQEGAFVRGGRPPKVETRGPWDQDDPTNAGLTIYIGSRMSGKFTRFYEKGKQLGDESSPWVRVETELHNSCYQLTLSMLLKPTQWFVAFYPCFEWIQAGTDRVELEYRQRIAEKTIEHSAKWIRHQAGGHLAALRQFYDDSELLDMLVRPDAIPESFLQANHGLQSLLAPSDCLTDEPGFVQA